MKEGDGGRRDLGRPNARQQRCILSTREIRPDVKPLLRTYGA